MAKDEVVVYSKPSCMQCLATYRELERQGVSYSSVDIEEDAQALEKIKEWGYLEVPVVEAGELRWSGFRPEKINQLVEA